MAAFLSGMTGPAVPRSSVTGSACETEDIEAVAAQAAMTTKKRAERRKTEVLPRAEVRGGRSGRPSAMNIGPQTVRIEFPAGARGRERERTTRVSGPRWF